ncbi:MAG: hypothetical protein EB127_24055, partial [Alphaproteobacteria bacterium]|nr:hypothetical protein [Alphaproteobacteria bacterium]
MSASPLTSQPLAPDQPILEMSSKARTIVRFGQESIGQAATFDLTGTSTTILFGAPSIQNIEGLKEFQDRFGNDEDIKKIMAMYWKITVTDSEKTVSYDPKTKNYRAPCAPNHIALLIKAFTKYREYMETNIKKEAGNQKKEALILQRNRIDAYMSILKAPRRDDCISGDEVKPRKPVSTDAGTLWHSVLPKIFKILYDKSKKGQKEVSIQEIRDEYDGLNKEVSQILEEIRADGTFKTDHDGMRATAVSVVELFNLLDTLFPDIFKKYFTGLTGLGGTPGGTSPTPADPEETIKIFESKLTYLDQEVKDCITNAIRSAIKNYNNNKLKAFWANIATAMECFKKVIGDLKAKIDDLKADIATKADEITRLQAQVAELEAELIKANTTITTSLETDNITGLTVPDEPTSKKNVADRIQQTIDEYRKKIKSLEDAMTTGSSGKDDAITALLEKLHSVVLSKDDTTAIEKEIRDDVLYGGYLKKYNAESDMLFEIKKYKIMRAIEEIIARMIAAL